MEMVVKVVATCSIIDQCQLSPDTSGRCLIENTLDLANVLYHHCYMNKSELMGRHFYVTNTLSISLAGSVLYHQWLNKLGVQA